MKNRILKFIIMLIIFILVIFAVYYFINQSNLLVKEKEINLYFATGDAMYLDIEKRTIKGRNLYLEAMSALIDGPQDPDLNKTIPDEVEVLDTNKNNNILEVNFNEKLIQNHWGGSTGERLTVYSIVNTLGEFEEIKQVRILIEGEEVETLVGHMDLSLPLSPNQKLIK